MGGLRSFFILMADQPANLIPFDGTFENLISQVTQSPDLVVVDFYAVWCPPCRRLAESLPQIARDFPKVTFLKVDIDESRELTNHYGVSSIPHLKFFKAGQGNQMQELGSVTGADIPQIRSKVQQFSS